MRRSPPNDPFADDPGLFPGVFGPRAWTAPPARLACASRLKSLTHWSCFSKTFQSLIVLSFVLMMNLLELAP